MFLGLDSSTQSLTAVLIDPVSGEITCQLSVNFGGDLPHYQSPSGFIPGGTDGEVHADPMMWIEALDLLLTRLAGKTDLSKVKMIAGSGQQHGSVYLDSSFDSRLGTLDPSQNLVAQLSPALTRSTSPIWMDTSTAAECAEITTAMRGPEEICRRSGSIAIERFTGPQIRRFYQSDPDAYERTSHIHLVSSFIGSVIAGWAAVLTALVVPMALAPQGAVDLSLHNAYLPGTVAAVAVALISRQTLAAILGGFVVYGLWRWLLV